MARIYPQETMGTTLVDVRDRDERRRVFVMRRKRHLEIGEFTRGSLTVELFGVPVHYHCIQLAFDHLGCVEDFFGQGEPFLSDFMDALDARGTPYGYLNDMVGQYVAYRPAGAVSQL